MAPSNSFIDNAEITVGPIEMSMETASIIVDAPLDPLMRKVESSSDFTTLTSTTLDSDSSSIASDIAEDDENADEAVSVSSAPLVTSPQESFEAASNTSLTTDSEVDEEIKEEPKDSRKKSVRFSLVHTREYNVVEEPPDTTIDINSEDYDPIVRRSLGWSYTESQSDIETHLNESHRERNARYAEIIADHIRRVEAAKEEKERRQRERDLLKKRGAKDRWGKVKKGLGKLGKGFIEVAGRTAFMVPVPQGGYGN